MNLSADGRLRLAARFAFVVGVGSLSSHAFAQEVEVAQLDKPAAAAPASGSESPDKVKQLGSVQVTGSRIKSPNLTSNSPVIVIGKEEIKFQGTTRVEDLLNSFPAAFAGQGGNLSNGADGTATVDLRFLGAARTLVLIDGKRVQAGAIGGSAADLNFIPAQLIEGIDVLTGGASAVYGSDAIAGVVNFKMIKDFEGVRIDYQRSGYQHTNSNSVGDIVQQRGFAVPDRNTFDGQGHQLSLTLGVNTADGKGNATVYASYLQLDPVSQDRRDFSACSLSNATSTSYGCVGSGTTFPTRFFNGGDNDLPFQITPDPATGGFRQYVAARDAFNFAPFNYFQRNQERYSAGGFAQYKFNDAAEVYTQLMFSDTRTNAVIAPSGIFGLTVPFSPDNPLLSDLQRDQLFGDSTDPIDLTVFRRNVEGGGRDNNLRFTAYRTMFGIRGDLGKAWAYDTSIQYGSTVYSQVYQNEFSKVRTRRALDVVADPTTGAPVCRSVLDGTDLGCVPYNVFSGQRVSADALGYLQVAGLQSGGTTQQIATGSINGDLGQYGLKSPVANDGVGVAFGAEYRRESAALDTDTSFQTDDLAGQGGATKPISGAFAVKELFGELRLPLAQGLPGIHDLGISAGYRFSDYTQTSSTDTYKIDGEYSPTKDIRFRGGYNRAVRAPNIGEIVNPTTLALGVTSDPCAGELGTDGVVSGGATREQCQNDPLIAANPDLYGNIVENTASQYNTLEGTSPGLGAEKADTYTGGFVFTPTFVKDLAISIDYYDIKVKGFISGYGGDTIIQACYERGALCDLIQRDANSGAAFGSLWIGNGGFVVNTTQNTGALTSNGVDVNVTYKMRLADLGLGSQAGSVVFDMQGTRLLESDVTPIPGDSSSTYQCSGRYGIQCGIPAPKWRHRFRTTYTLPTPYLLDSQVRLSTAWRYFGAVTADDATPANQLNQRLGAKSYVDLSAAVTFSGAYTFRVGVQNITDNDPPVISSQVGPGTVANGNTFPQVYDALGRFLYANVVLDF